MATVDLPLVSVLIRSMDRPTLERALQSVERQTWANLEIVVVAACGGSHRALPRVWNGRELKLLRSDRPLGRSEAANTALQAARGTYFNFLDDDDELLPEHVETLKHELDLHDGAQLAFARQEVLDSALVRVAVFGLAGGNGEPFSRLALFDEAAFGINAALFHRGLFERGARFDTALECCEDHDFWLQCACLTRFVAVDRITSRWHGFVGDSGGGWGRNWNGDKMRVAAARVAAKWRSVRAAYETSRKGRLEAAQRSLFRDSPEAARLRCEATLSRLPDDPSALNFAALANHRVGDAARARHLVSRALALLPGHPLLTRNAALIEAAITAPRKLSDE
jgi:hypothetical protein